MSRMQQLVVFLLATLIALVARVSAGAGAVPWLRCDERARPDEPAFCLGAVNNRISLGKRSSCFLSQSCDLFVIGRIINRGPVNVTLFEVFANVSETSSEDNAITEVSWIKMFFTKTKIDFMHKLLYVPIHRGYSNDTSFTYMDIILNTKSLTGIRLLDEITDAAGRDLLLQPESSNGERAYTQDLAGFKYHSRFAFSTPGHLKVDFRRFRDNQPPYDINLSQEAVYPYVIQYKETLQNKLKNFTDQYGQLFNVMFHNRLGDLQIGNILRLGNAIKLFDDNSAAQTDTAVPEVAPEQEPTIEKQPEPPSTSTRRPPPPPPPPPPPRPPPKPDTIPRPPPPKPAPTDKPSLAEPTDQPAASTESTPSSSSQSTATSPPPSSTSKTPDEERGGSSIGMILIFVGVLVVLFLLAAAIGYAILRKRKSSKYRLHGRDNLKARSSLSAMPISGVGSGVGNFFNRSEIHSQTHAPSDISTGHFNRSTMMSEVPVVAAAATPSVKPKKVKSVSKPKPASPKVAKASRK